MNSLKIVFVLPTKNEEKTIGPLLSDLKSISDKNNWLSETIVVDDSNDKTREVAIEHNAKIVPGDFQGLGYAMLKGLAFAQQKNPDYIVTLDTDGQVDLSEIPKFIETMSIENYDVILSSRFLENELIKYKYPLINYIGNRILVFILRYCTHFPFTDSHGGIRVLKPKTLEGLKLMGLHTYVQETLISFCRNGYKVKELPSQWNERKHSQSRVLKSMGQYIIRTLPGLLYLMKFHQVFFILSILIGAIHLLFFPDSFQYISLGLLFFALSVLIFFHSKRALHIRDFINEK